MKLNQKDPMQTEDKATIKPREITLHTKDNRICAKCNKANTSLYNPHTQCSILNDI